MPIQAQFNVKVYAMDGVTLRESLSPDLLKAPVSFRSRINSGLGELVLDLNLPFDDFGEGTSIDFMNVVDVWAVVGDKEAKTQAETRIYRGFISRYEPYVDRQEGVRVTCLGLGSLATFLYYKSGGSFTVTHTTQDPESIGRSIIDALGADYPGLISYDAASTDPVGTNTSFTFTDQKCFDCLAKVQQAAGTGWWWSIDCDGKYNLRAKPSASTHTFTIGKDIDFFNAPKDSEKLINDVQVRRVGGAASDYSDSASITRYGRHAALIGDSAIGDLTTANQRGNKAIADQKDPKIKAQLAVNTNYPIESVRVGDTCRIRNLSGTFFTDNLQIVGLSYEATRIRLDLEQGESDFGLAIQGLVG